MKAAAKFLGLFKTSEKKKQTQESPSNDATALKSLENTRSSKLQTDIVENKKSPSQPEERKKHSPKSSKTNSSAKKSSPDGDERSNKNPPQSMNNGIRRSRSEINPVKTTEDSTTSKPRLNTSKTMEITTTPHNVEQSFASHSASELGNRPVTYKNSTNSSSMYIQSTSTGSGQYRPESKSITKLDEFKRSPGSKQTAASINKDLEDVLASSIPPKKEKRDSFLWYLQEAVLSPPPADKASKLVPASHDLKAISSTENAARNRGLDTRQSENHYLDSLEIVVRDNMSTVSSLSDEAEYSLRSPLSTPGKNKSPSKAWSKRPFDHKMTLALLEVEEEDDSYEPSEDGNVIDNLPPIILGDNNELIAPDIAYQNNSLSSTKESSAKITSLSTEERKVNLYARIDAMLGDSAANTSKIREEIAETPVTSRPTPFKMSTILGATTSRFLSSESILLDSPLVKVSLATDSAFSDDHIQNSPTDQLVERNLKETAFKTREVFHSEVLYSLNSEEVDDQSISDYGDEGNDGVIKGITDDPLWSLLNSSNERQEIKYTETLQKFSNESHNDIKSQNSAPFILFRVENDEKIQSRDDEIDVHNSSYLTPDDNNVPPEVSLKNDLPDIIIEDIPIGILPKEHVSFSPATPALDISRSLARTNEIFDNLLVLIDGPKSEIKPLAVDKDDVDTWSKDPPPVLSNPNHVQSDVLVYCDVESAVNRVMNSLSVTQMNAAYQKAMGVLPTKLEEHDRLIASTTKLARSLETLEPTDKVHELLAPNWSLQLHLRRALGADVLKDPLVGMSPKSDRYLSTFYNTNSVKKANKIEIVISSEEISDSITINDNERQTEHLLNQVANNNPQIPNSLDDPSNNFPNRGNILSQTHLEALNTVRTMISASDSTVDPALQLNEDSLRDMNDGDLVSRFVFSSDFDPSRLDSKGTGNLNSAYLRWMTDSGQDLLTQEVAAVQNTLNSSLKLLISAAPPPPMSPKDSIKADLPDNENIESSGKPTMNSSIDIKDVDFVSDFITKAVMTAATEFVSENAEPEDYYAYKSKEVKYDDAKFEFFQLNKIRKMEAENDLDKSLTLFELCDLDVDKLFALGRTVADNKTHEMYIHAIRSKGEDNFQVDEHSDFSLFKDVTEASKLVDAELTVSPFKDVHVHIKPRYSGGQYLVSNSSVNLPLNQYSNTDYLNASVNNASSGLKKSLFSSEMSKLKSQKQSGLSFNKMASSKQTQRLSEQRRPLHSTSQKSNASYEEHSRATYAYRPTMSVRMEQSLPKMRKSMSVTENIRNRPQSSDKKHRADYNGKKVSGDTSALSKYYLTGHVMSTSGRK